MMQKLKVIGLTTALAISLSGCTRIGPGYVGIKVSMAGTNRGVEDTPATTGWQIYNPAFSRVFEYPTFVQTVVLSQSKDEGNPVDESISFTNKDNMQIFADISMSYHLVPEKVPAFYVKFRSDDLHQFTLGYLRNITRDAFNEHGGKYTIDQIMGDNSKFIADVRQSLQTELTPIGVQVDQFGLIGAPRPPQVVLDAINAKVHATQLAMQKQNELVQAQAEAAKTVATAEGAAKALELQSTSQAEANIRLAKSLTPELIELKRLETWNGVLPQVTGTATPFINLQK